MGQRRLVVSGTFAKGGRLNARSWMRISRTVKQMLEQEEKKVDKQR